MWSWGHFFQLLPQKRGSLVYVFRQAPLFAQVSVPISASRAGGVPETTLRPGDSLGFTGLRKAHILIIAAK